MAKKTKSPTPRKKSIDPAQDHYGYLHGYDPTEQDRLVRQAHLLEPMVYGGMQWDEGCTEILEPGCGVGAQTEILLRRFPQLRVTGVDRQASQIARAKKNLAQAVKKNRVDLVQASGERLPFDDSRFHGAFVCWLLEHVPQPVELLKEIHRVLQPGGKVYCTEVLNSSFFLHPYAPATLQYWFLFNDHQWNMGGDPFLGAKLGNHLLDAGFQDIRLETRTYQLDKRTPKLREQHMRAFYDLLRSGAPSLIEHKRADEALIREMDKEWKAALQDPNSVLYFSFVQGHAVAL